MRKIIGFAPALLQVVMAQDIDMPVRQAGVIYLKNLVSQYWNDQVSFLSNKIKNILKYC